MGWSLKNIIDPSGLIVGGGLSGSKGLLGGGEDGVDPIARPKYYEDPDYRAAQDALKGMGLEILKGEVPDYYKPIGEFGGPQFESMLGLTTRDIQRSAAEGMAASGRARGGALPAVTAGAIADAATKLRYSDFIRAISGRQNLLNTGINVTSSVRSAGQNQGTSKNQFNWNDYNAQVAERAYQDQMEAQKDAQLGEFIGTIASIGLGAATGGMSFGLQGAMAGGLDAFTGGGTNFLGLLSKSKNPTRAAAGVSDLGSIGDEWTAPQLSGYFQ